ncbi:DUF2268 domain-containing putative Zn-dependent protease [Aquiflexum sp.]|uniref:gliding motility protein GldB-related protein n=1 Tax=Aquiflexum sp. TaxID=1872584 RepID=UPI003593C216
MKIILILFLSFSAIGFSSFARSPLIVTSDIDNFWDAFDRLHNAKTRKDSVQIMDVLYLGKASNGFKKLIKARHLTAEKYIAQIGRYPEYWKSVRENTTSIEGYRSEIEDQIELYGQALKNFKAPKICFAIGILSTGGTVRDGWLLIGTEMVASDSTTVREGMNGWLKHTLPKKPMILEFTAHEMVHTQQRFGPGVVWGHLNHRLLTMTIMEGAADFIAEKVTGTSINVGMYAYGYEHEEQIWKEFSQEMYGNNYSKWLYNGNNSKDRPADLGYFIGYRICESYYNNAADKEKALNKILKTNNFRKFLKKSGYGYKFNKS